MKKTNLFDKKGIEIYIGDQYKVEGFDTIFTVYFKGGAVCGGRDCERAIPLPGILVMMKIFLLVIIT